jgi:membrane-associated phospholipid phosphatase
MGRTIFEGELPGANDPFILMILSALFIYIGSQRANISIEQRAWGIDAGFVLISALTVAFLMVQGPKWTMGRARPDLVFEHGVTFSHWFAFGPFYIAEGPYRGAFPSGHTAQAFIAMAVAYVLAGNPFASRFRKQLGWVWGGIALLFTILMGAARCISSSHWLTDVTGSLVFGWILMHWLYFRWLRVHDRHRYLRQYGYLPPNSGYLETKSAIYFLMITLGAVLIGNGLRALLFQQALFMIGLVPIGIALIVFTIKKWPELRASIDSNRIPTP